MAEQQDGADAAGSPEVGDQAREQTGQQQVRLRINDANVTTDYANAFRTNTTAEEVAVDFGLNLVTPTPGASPEAGSGKEIAFNISRRVVMNHYTAKRLAMMLGQIVRLHEQQFGELKLNAAERASQGQARQSNE